MAITKINMYQVECDSCKRNVVIKAPYQTLPKGWGYTEVIYGTGYYDHYQSLRCPKCLKSGDGE